MCAGVLLHRFATIDEFDLHGRGREIRAVGGLFVLGGLLLAALPPFTTFAGKSLLEESASSLGYNWLIVVFVVASAHRRRRSARRRPGVRRLGAV